MFSINRVLATHYLDKQLYQVPKKLQRFRFLPFPNFSHRTFKTDNEHKNWSHQSSNHQNNKNSKKLPLIIGSISAFCFFSSSSPDDLINKIHSNMSYKLESSKEIPGLSPSEFEANKAEMLKLNKKLLKDGFVEMHGPDSLRRPIFVGWQIAFENVIASLLALDQLHSFDGYIHTPMPATPLCTKGDISKELVAPEIANDPARRATVEARPITIRLILNCGGRMHILYPKVGKNKRTPEQQEIYKQELARYSDILFDQPLGITTEELPADLIGATYFFIDKKGNEFFFSMKMTQAKNPEEIGHSAIWFGRTDDPKFKSRLNDIYELARK